MEGSNTWRRRPGFGAEGVVEMVSYASSFISVRQLADTRFLNGQKPPNIFNALDLIPVPYKLDDGVARHTFALDFADNFARALVFVYADRRDKFLLPDQRLDAQARLQHRDGDHPDGALSRTHAPGHRRRCPRG